MIIDVNKDDLKENDPNALPIVLSHLQKCTLIQHAIYNHLDESYDVFDDKNANSESDSNVGTICSNTDFDSDTDLISVSDLDSDSESGFESDSDSGNESGFDSDSDIVYTNKTKMKTKTHEQAISYYNYKHLSAKECEDLYDTCILLMTDYVYNHPTHFSEPSFHTMFESTIHHMIYNYLEDLIFMNVEVKREMKYIAHIALRYFFRTVAPIRSYPDTRIIRFNNSKKKQYLANHINVLRTKPQPAQRTKAWYNFRNNLLSASNAYKIWGSDKVQNSLILEKCKMVDVNNAENNEETQNKTAAIFINVNSPLHHGQKYEPMSVLVYENEYDTKIEEFGCIQHDVHHFIGASPDGINVDPTSPRYGRMLEIKNIVNREINGIPKKEYWIQMQLQMEVCGLDECDFLETRFIEYESYFTFKEDYDNNGRGSKDNNDGKYRGLLIYFTKQPSFNENEEFISADPTPVYEYCPPTFTLSEMESWEEQTCAKRKSNGFAWVRNIYWKLETISCVLVSRNRIWFNNCVEDIARFWKVIERERIVGYAHREPTRRVIKDTSAGANVKHSYDLPEKICFIKINKSES